jgi:PAS domain S-box-containing protein
MQNEAEKKGMSGNTATAIPAPAKESICLLDSRGVVLKADTTTLETPGGYSSSGVAGHAFNEFMTPEIGYARRLRLDEVISSGKPVRFEDEMNGILFDNHYFPVSDETGRVTRIAVFSRDITGHKRADQSLPETSQYRENLINYANTPLIVWDPQFRITRFNSAFEHLTGLKAADVMGKPLEVLFPKSFLAEVMELIRKTMAGERWDNVEIPVLSNDGSVKTVLWNSAPQFGSDGKTMISVIAQGLDITERKKMERENRQKAADMAALNTALKEEITHRRQAESTAKKAVSQLNAAIESTADGIYVISLAGKITGYNQNFSSMWNIPEGLLQSLDNRKVSDYLALMTKKPEVFQADNEEPRQHKDRESYDMLELKDGRIFERYSKPQRLGKTIVGRVWSFRDVTERRNAEQKLVASLQEKETLIREIHHRVKNNLQIISGLLDMTRMRTKDPLTTGILTDMMMKIKTMAQIHTRLYESKQFDRINMGAQIRDQVTDLSGIYGRTGAEITTDIEIQEIFLPVDQAIPCALVVNEILSNAFKHAFTGRMKGTIRVSVTQTDSYFRIRIQDDGVGIPGDVDVYHTTSLGLKLIRSLVMQLRGTLVINSGQEGSEVIVEFPFRISGS